MAPSQMIALPNRADTESTWLAIESGLNKVFNAENVDVQTYIQIYTFIHDFCTTQKAVSARVNGVIGGAHRGAHLLGEDLYAKLSLYLRDRLVKIHQEAQGRTPDDLLDYYNVQWDRFVACGKFNNTLFRYLQKTWVKRENDEGKNIYNVFDLHLRKWKVGMLDTMQESFSGILLDMIRRQRDGEFIQQLPRKSFISSIILLRSAHVDRADSYSEKESDTAKNSKVTQDWEELFNSSTAEYYKNVAAQDLVSSNIEAYIDSVEQRVDDEEKNTALFLPDSMKLAIVRTCKKILITDHIDVFLNRFDELLTLDHPSALAQLYRLLDRVPNGLDNCYEKFETHVRKTGLDGIEGTVALITTGHDSPADNHRRNREQSPDQSRNTVNPTYFCRSVSTTIKKYQQCVNNAFNADKKFARSVDRACRAFVNWNRACIYDSDAPELLAKHVEFLLKRGGGTMMSESDLHGEIVNSAIIFKYLEDKDAFITLYRRMLAKRLVQGTSASAETEKTMLHLMAEVYNHTGKLKQMLLDIDTVKDLDGSFMAWQLQHESNLSNLAAMTSFKVLSAANWPLKPSDTAFRAPESISHSHEQFTKFYHEAHPGRKLFWHWQLCYGEMRMNLENESGKVYTLTASAYQIAILVLFIDHDQLSFEEIKKETSLEIEILDGLLTHFTRIKLLKCDERNSSKIYAINEKFRIKKVKIDIRVSIKKQKNAELRETYQKIKEERSLLTQAALVRIMKTRKKMTYQQLALESADQLQSRFALKDQDMKRCVDLLVDKAYLERLDDGCLGYLA